MLVTLARAVLAASLPFMLAAAAAAQPYWPINDGMPSREVTGTTGQVFPVQSPPGADEQMPPALARTPAASPAAAAPEVDESALRYFASRGDTRRLEIEIARLRALYPQWTPPVDPLAIPPSVDERLEAIWQLYAEGRLAEAREAIAARQADEPDWQPPPDLLDRLALAEARERLINASDIAQYGTVIGIASQNPHLLTCGEVDVLWRVAEAFARTEREGRARDAYRYILSNCDDPGERLATMQNAGRLLSEPLVEELLGLERTDPSGVGEFAAVRDDRARDAVARGGKDASAAVPPDQLARLERLAREERHDTDARLLGWYHLQRQDHARAEQWFRMAREIEDSADASQGLALALIASGHNAEAEEVVYPWRDASDDARKVYLASAANLLGDNPRLSLPQAVLARIVATVAAARDAPSARQLGWYARAWEQHETAGRWFTTALRWDPDDEPSAYGLALTRHLLRDATGLAEIKRAWSARSERIRQVGSAGGEPAPARPATPSEGSSVRTPRTAAPLASSDEAPRPRARGGCPSIANVGRLGPQAALEQGWCLMEARRHLEAARAFEVALRSAGSERIRRDAAWGQSLAYLRVEAVDEAAVAATAAPQDPRRAAELQTAILAQRAAGAFERRRYVEVLIALDQRAQIAPERVDLMVLRGYAYFHLGRMGDARRVFEAAAGTGSRDAVRGLAAVNERLTPSR